MFYEDPHCALEYLHIYSIKCSTSEQLDEWLTQSELDDSDMAWDKTQIPLDFTSKYCIRFVEEM